MASCWIRVFKANLFCMNDMAAVSYSLLQQRHITLPDTYRRSVVLENTKKLVLSTVVSKISMIFSDGIALGRKVTVH